MNFLRHVGQSLRSRILKSGYATLEIFAHENNIPKSTLSEILNGKNDPKLTTLAKICAGLDITLTELFKDPKMDEWVRESARKHVTRRPSRTD